VWSPLCSRLAPAASANRIDDTSPWCMTGVTARFRGGRADGGQLSGLRGPGIGDEAFGELLPVGQRDVVAEDLCGLVERLFGGVLVVFGGHREQRQPFGCDAAQRSDQPAPHGVPVADEDEGRYNAHMTGSSSSVWSPADSPYAIAVSQAQLWRDVVMLTVYRMRDQDDDRVLWSSRQLDAHVLVMTLRQLLTAEQLEQAALTELGVDPAVGATLAVARQQFEDALPGIKDMRDALMHFDEWSQGKGRGPQKTRRQARDDLREIARDFWRFGYDPTAGIVEFGPYTVEIDVAPRAAGELTRAIDLAAQEVDKASVVQLRAETIVALTAAGIQHNAPDDVLRVSPGTDLRVWLSFRPDSGVEEQHLRTLAEQIVGALTHAGFHLESTNLAEHLETAERLVRRESLRVAKGAGEEDTGAAAPADSRAG
jgi:hypothetical protein